MRLPEINAGESEAVAMETTLSTVHQLWHKTLSLPGIIDLCFLCFVLRQQRFKVRSLIKNFGVCIDHSSLDHTIPHTYTTRNQALFEMMC